MTRHADPEAVLRSLSRERGFECGLTDWSDGVLRGFAVDLAAPQRTLSLALEADGASVAHFATGEPQPDLSAAAPGNVAGFTFDFASLSPAALGLIETALAEGPPGAPLETGKLALRIGNDGPRIDLSRDGLTRGHALAQCRAARRRAAAAPPPRPAARGPRYLAGVDGLDGSILRGWAVDLVDARTPVALALVARGRRLAGFTTDEHRADIGAVLADNRAGFRLNLAALTQEATQALAKALTGADAAAPVPPERAALLIVADGSEINLGGFSVTVGAVLGAIGRTPPATAARPRTKPPAGPASMLDWLLLHIGAEAPAKSGAEGPAKSGAEAPASSSAEARAGSSPSRRFAQKLLDDIERIPSVSETIKLHVRDIAPLFDPFHYLDRIERPEEAIANPLLHYALAGWRDGASPHPLFAPDHYCRLRGQIAGDPLLDFVREGAGRNVDPHPLFDMAFYRARWLNGDAKINPLVHYLETGGRQRLDPSPRFDSSAFLARFGLGDEIDNPLESFVVTPQYQEFEAIPGFDAALYRYQVEIERGERIVGTPYTHYLARGFSDETLRPNILFDPAFYRERNSLDLAEPALTHYLREGEAAGFACHPHFDPVFYNGQRGVEGGTGALEHALAHPGQHRSDFRMEAPLDRRVFDFVRDLVAERGEDAFRHSVYREANPDLGAIDEAQARAHYRNNGDREGRLASLTRFMRLAAMRICDVALGFVLEDYVAIYPDLGNFSGRFLNGFFHWGRHGRLEKRLIGRWLFHIDGLALDLPTAGAPLRVEPTAERVDVCILIHAFYPDLLPELVGFAQNFRDATFDIFINVVDLSWTPGLQEELRAICPGAYVMLSNDSGRDIGGFTRLLQHVDIARYDLFALMHSKKSPHVAPEKGEHWRRQLLTAIAGSPETARQCVALMRENPGVGMIGARQWRSNDMGKNIEQYERLLDLLGVSGKNRELDYVSGFMFLVRSDVVARLYETLRLLDFEYGGDKDLDFHIDGQIAHGVERAVPALVRQMGYEIHYR